MTNEEKVGPNSTDSSCALIPNSGGLSVEDIKSQILDFSNSLNSTYRLSLSKCHQPDKDDFIYLLLHLKKNINAILKELDEPKCRDPYEFCCGLCDETIFVSPDKDIWSTLQEHEHFEMMYYQFLNSSLEILALNTIPSSRNSLVHENSQAEDTVEEFVCTGESNTDSGIDQQEPEPSTSHSQENGNSNSKAESKDNAVNNFRFNFNGFYSELVQSKIYPLSMMNAVQKLDKAKYYTIMRIGPKKAVCLICHCNLVTTKVNKHSLTSHTAGQKHLRAARQDITVEFLRTFHEFWLKQEPPVQAHQIYFKFKKSLTEVKCELCNEHCLISEIIDHIKSDVHKINVLEPHVNTAYYLVSLQTQVYGLNEGEVEAITSQQSTPKKSIAKTRNSKTPNFKKNDSLLVHNIIKSVENSESDNDDLIKQLPHRMKKHASLLEISNIVKCGQCSIQIKYKVEDLRHHLGFFHDNMGYKYYCDLCECYENNERRWIKHNLKHSNHTNLPVHRKRTLGEYECITCKLVIYGDEISLMRHRTMKSKPFMKAKRRIKLPDDIKNLLKSKESVEEIAEILNIQAEFVVKDSQTEQCCAELESVLDEYFKDCEVYPFGSRISGLGNINSDLDIFVDIGGSFYGENNQDPGDQVTIIRKVQRVLQKHENYNSLIPIISARTPILKLYHAPSKLKYDLSFKHGLSVKNTEFIRLCVQLQPMCQKLILIIKKWAKSIGFDNISNYALSIMCIFYMQINEYLLSVKQIRELNNNKQAKSIAGWQCIDYVVTLDEMKTYVKTYDDSISELLINFFKYYTKFNFSQHVISPLLGNTIMRIWFSEGETYNLPPEMSPYLDQLNNDDKEVFRIDSHMCIQDPFDLSHNLTKAVKQDTVSRFQSFCKLSYTYFEELK
ncbi:hypothetical protein ABEB36_004375 [Hypothenemus hampei]|uniref:Uncharacterized protein n=1 Tax=Hypothenemus hampei TaxID=57062 RepID=A0ABD1F357_HYPHA